MKIKECIKCGAFVDATDAPPGATIYCTDCFPKEPKPIERKVKSVPHRFKRIEGVPSYRTLEQLPEEGRWVTIAEATKILDVHLNTIPIRVKTGRYKLAYVNGVLYLDLKSYQRKKNVRVSIEGIRVIQGRCICLVEEGMRYRQCNGKALYKWRDKKEYCMRHYSEVRKGKSPKTVYDLEKK